MVGAGAVVFAVMGYIIANQEPDRKLGSIVRLNPKLLAMILGETEKEITQAIDYLLKPDPKSNSPEKGGRRIIKVGQFDYQVVNGEKYRRIRSQDDRREQNRTNQRRYQWRKKLPMEGEQEYINAMNEGANPDELDAIIEKYLPEYAKAASVELGEATPDPAPEQPRENPETESSSQSENSLPTELT